MDWMVARIGIQFHWGHHLRKEQFLILQWNNNTDNFFKVKETFYWWMISREHPKHLKVIIKENVNWQLKKISHNVLKVCLVLHQEKVVEKTKSINLPKEEKESWKSHPFLSPTKSKRKCSAGPTKSSSRYHQKNDPPLRKPKDHRHEMDHPKVVETIFQKLAPNGQCTNRWVGDVACWQYIRHKEGEIDK